MCVCVRACVRVCVRVCARAPVCERGRGWVYVFILGKNERDKAIKWQSCVDKMENKTNFTKVWPVDNDKKQTFVAQTDCPAGSSRNRHESFASFGH